MFGLPVWGAALAGAIIGVALLLWVFAFFLNLHFGPTYALKAATLWALLFIVIAGGGVLIELGQHGYL